MASRDETEDEDDEENDEEPEMRERMTFGVCVYGNTTRHALPTFGESTTTCLFDQLRLKSSNEVSSGADDLAKWT